MKDNKLSRRTFLGGVLATGALLNQGCASVNKTFHIVPRHVLGGKGFVPPSEKLNIACVGLGGKGVSDAEGVASQNIVALCDVDDNQMAQIAPLYPKAQKFRDFRKMLDTLKGIDAVVVSTPDHTHAVISMAAIQRGKHVYCQKPLARTVEEVRKLTAAAREHKVVTQMGIQGHQTEGPRRTCEWIWSGAIGDVREVRYWTNRPIWPQGLTRPAETPPVPSTLDWDLWLGPAPFRPYNPAYLPFAWRGWWDFGCGALGDMACHMMDTAFWALDLGYPESIEAECGGQTRECAPNWSIITYQFPARGKRPPVKVVWCDGGKLPERPPELEPERKLNPDGGQFIIGDKGTILADVYGGSPRLIPESKMGKFLETKPPKLLPRSVGSHEEWLAAIKGFKTPYMADFDYSGPLTEMVLLGNLALRTGQKITYDPKRMTTNVAEADQYLHYQCRKGWEI